MTTALCMVMQDTGEVKWGFRCVQDCFTDIAICMHACESAIRDSLYLIVQMSV